MLNQKNEAISFKSVLDFWFSEPVNKLWFKSTPEFDTEVRNKYYSLWVLAKEKQLLDWQESAEGCLALTIILDQFPLNMFRGSAKSFSTEADAIQITRLSITKGFDKELNSVMLPFLYMPLMHSENIDDQNLSVKLFEKSGFENNLRFAKHHREIIKKFGRFPHRNVILNRTSTEEEIEYLKSPHAFTG